LQVLKTSPGCQNVEANIKSSFSVHSSDLSTFEHAQFACLLLTFKEVNGHQPFVYISTCCCIFTQAGLKTVSTSSSSSRSSLLASPNLDDPAEAEKTKSDKQIPLCPQCATKYPSHEDVHLLNLISEEEELVCLVMERVWTLEPEKKEGKKRKIKEGEETALDQPPAKQPDTRSTLNPTAAVANMRSKVAWRWRRRSGRRV
jgi:hypothetical protein